MIATTARTASSTAAAGTCAAPTTNAWEDQLGALGLVLNYITLWTPSTFDAALTQLRQRRLPVRDEDDAEGRHRRSYLPTDTAGCGRPA